MVQLMNKFGDWRVWYPERQKDCPFQVLPLLVDIRARWHPKWSYFESLRQIEFRILRCVEIEKDKGELVSEWSLAERTSIYSDYG